MTNDAHLQTLDAAHREAFHLFVEKATFWSNHTPHSWGYCSVVIVESHRDIFLQAGLYSQGRTWDKFTKKWTKVGTTVTDVIDSKHVQGLAIDVACKKSGGEIFWPEPRQKDAAKADEARTFWLSLAEIAESVGLKSGAKWNHEDWDHFEI